jgi:hypothetical protein
MSWDKVLPFILRPLFLLALLLAAAMIGAAIRRQLPINRVTRVLTRSVGIEAARTSWWPFFAWLIGAALIWVPLIWWASTY